MSRYRVDFTRTIYHRFEVEADSRADAAGIVKSITNENTQAWEKAQDYWIEDEIGLVERLRTKPDTTVSGFSFGPEPPAYDPPGYFCPACGRPDDLPHGEPCERDDDDLELIAAEMAECGLGDDLYSVDWQIVEATP